MGTPHKKRKAGEADFQHFLTPPPRKKNSKKSLKRSCLAPMDQVLTPLRQCSRKKDPSNRCNPRDSIDWVLKRSKKLQGAQMHLSDWVAHVDHVETTVNQAKEDQEAADAEYQALNLSKQKAAADKDECDRDLARLEAEKKKAEKNFKIRQARIIARREKATAAWDSANGKTMHVNEKKAMADFKFSTAKDLLDERKKRLPVFQLPVERVSRTYAFMSAEEIFDNLEIPFDTALSSTSP